MPFTKAVSEYVAQNVTIPEGMVCISISDSPYDDKTKELYNKFEDVLFLNFLDLEYPIPEYEDRLFNRKHAEEIIDFCLNHKDKNILVHCAAGISRSQAVSLFIAKYIYEDLDLFSKLYHDNSKIENGNILVYRELCHYYETNVLRKISDHHENIF